MAQTFRICTELVGLIKQLGFRREINFDFFLYPNEIDSREVFSFLLEKTSQKGKEQEVEEEVKYLERMSIEERMNQKLNELVKTTWNQRTNVNNHYQCLNPIKTTFISCGQFKNQNLVSKQVTLDLSSSIFEDNEIKLYKQELSQKVNTEQKWNYLKDSLRVSNKTNLFKKENSIMKSGKGSGVGGTLHEDSLNEVSGAKSGFNLRKEFETTASASTTAGGGVGENQPMNQEEQEKKRMEEMENLNKSVEKLKKAIQNIEEKILKMNSNIQQIEDLLEKEKEKKIKVEKTLKVIATTQKLLENKDENTMKMKKITSSTGQHLIELAKEWENHRLPLIEKIRKLKRDEKNMKLNYNEKLESVKKNRKLLEETVSDIKSKEDLLNKLKQDLTQLPKNIERKNYVDRIMDISKNVDKQKLEINKILLDNHLILNESNELSKKLLETFQVVEDVIFKEAEKEEYAKTLYQNVVQMRDGFSSLIKLVKGFFLLNF
jgi:coiled-coil domain-containing protein 22